MEHGTCPVKKYSILFLSYQPCYTSPNVMPAPSHPPLYRVIFHEALSTAWHHPHLWVFALFAGLLMTGGMYDVLFRSLGELGVQATTLLAGTDTSFVQSFLHWMMQPMEEMSAIFGVLGVIGRLQGLLAALLLVLLVGGASVIAQGALVYGLGIRHRGQLPSFHACLTIGARFFWKTAFLNLVTLGLLWIFRTLVLAPFLTPLEETSWFTLVSSFGSLALYIVAVIVLTSTHMLALTSLVLQKYDPLESLARGFFQTCRSWLVILELGVGFFLIGTGLFLGLMLLYIVAGVPVLVLTLSLALLQSGWLATLLNTLFFGGAIVAALLCGTFAITMQYAAWNGLGLRIAQGTALAKLHRFFKHPSSR